jgi:hypothetical protein
MTEFDLQLSESIASAKAKLAELEQAQRFAEAAERKKAQKIADQFAEVKGQAKRFKHNHLEPLFRKVHQKVSEAGFHFVGNYIDQEEPNRGAVGSTLESGEDTFVRAIISFTLDSSTAFVDARTSKGQCYSANQQFDEATSLAWFERHVALAVGKLLESGDVPMAGMVRFGGRA